MLRSFRNISNQPEDKGLGNDETRPLIGCDRKGALDPVTLDPKSGTIRGEDISKALIGSRKKVALNPVQIFSRLGSGIHSTATLANNETANYH